MAFAVDHALHDGRIRCHNAGSPRRPLVHRQGAARRRYYGSPGAGCDGCLGDAVGSRVPGDEHRAGYHRLRCGRCAPSPLVRRQPPAAGGGPHDHRRASAGHRLQQPRQLVAGSRLDARPRGFGATGCGRLPWAHHLAHVVGERGVVVDRRPRWGCCWQFGRPEPSAPPSYRWACPHRWTCAPTCAYSLSRWWCRC